MGDSNVKEVIDALREAESEALVETTGYVYFNGVRNVHHPKDCNCHSEAFQFGMHCWCCGYLQYDPRCECETAKARICAKCGCCDAHCHCSKTDVTEL